MMFNVKEHQRASFFDLFKYLGSHVCFEVCWQLTGPIVSRNTHQKELQPGWPQRIIGAKRNFQQATFIGSSTAACFLMSQLHLQNFHKLSMKCGNYPVHLYLLWQKHVCLHSFKTCFSRKHHLFSKRKIRKKQSQWKFPLQQLSS